MAKIKKKNRAYISHIKSPKEEQQEKFRIIVLNVWYALRSPMELFSMFWRLSDSEGLRWGGAWTPLFLNYVSDMHQMSVTVLGYLKK